MSDRCSTGNGDSWLLVAVVVGVFALLTRVPQTLPAPHQPKTYVDVEGRRATGFYYAAQKDGAGMLEHCFDVCLCTERDIRCAPLGIPSRTYDPRSDIPGGG